MKRVLMYLGAIALSFVIFLASLTVVRTLDQTAELSQATVSALIDACETSRTPLNKYFSDQLAESESHGIDYYRQRFPDYPPQELRRQIKKQRERLRDVVTVVDPATCADQYQ
jgi:hypothetical protein